MSAGDPVPAIGEAEASGDVAALYADIRTTLGVGVVNLIWRHLATIDPSIGYSTEVIELYAATRLTHVGARLDVGEHLEVFEADIDDALDWVRQGVITDTKTTFALLWWKNWGR